MMKLLRHQWQLLHGHHMVIMHQQLLPSKDR